MKNKILAVMYFLFWGSVYSLTFGPLIPREYYIAAINPAFLYLLISSPVLFPHAIYTFIKKPRIFLIFASFATLLSVAFCFFNPQYYAPLFFKTLKTESFFEPSYIIYRDRDEPIHHELDLKPICDLEGICDVFLPPDFQTKSKLPLIFRLGHPGDGRDFDQKKLLTLYSRTPSECIFVRSGILDHMISKYPTKTFSVNDKKIFREIAPYFPKLIDELKKKYPIDSEKIIFTGFSMDGVYAWMLGLEYPDLCSGVLAMSAVSYPELIKDRLGNLKSKPTIVVRAQRDGMFPFRFNQEVNTGRELMALNPKSEWVLIYGKRHSGISMYWPKYLNILLSRL
ncbi:MAG: hypothetical protein KKB51_08650 [Candidatus Riflebacteria bacterium]|nr:hypothetical protein [Candidatus Riflebacteria bacterium]